jgi:hypothetical protein
MTDNPIPDGKQDTGTTVAGTVPIPGSKNNSADPSTTPVPLAGSPDAQLSLSTLTADLPIHPGSPSIDFNPMPVSDGDSIGMEIREPRMASEVGVASLPTPPADWPRRGRGQSIDPLTGLFEFLASSESLVVAS